jgi:hypothetical protein
MNVIQNEPIKYISELDRIYKAGNATAQFFVLAAPGAKLRRLHLLEGVEPLSGMAIYPEEGNSRAENLSCKNSKVWINDTQYFDSVPYEAWNFYTGGCQTVRKWLKDRKGRVSGYDSIRHYQRIIRVLKETGEVMRKTDEKNIMREYTFV